MLDGTFTALITPFTADAEAVDYERLKTHIAGQAAGGVDGVVPCGTTGESPTLSHQEHRRVIEVAVEAAAGTGLKVLAGTGSNSTREALELTRHAAEAGVDAALMVNPYYNKPDQEGLYRHFSTVADAVDLPIVLYNIPGRTGITMSVDTIARLAEHRNIVAVKDATGSIDMTSEVVARCGEGCRVFSGDDSLTLPMMSVGAVGVISVLSNLLPQRVKALQAAAAAGHFADARAHHLGLFPLFRACLSMAVNPVTIKAAMRLAGHDSGALRLPLVPLEDAATGQLRRLLQDAGVETAG